MPGNPNNLVYQQLSKKLQKDHALQNIENHYSKMWRNNGSSGEIWFFAHTCVETKEAHLFISSDTFTISKLLFQYQ